MKKVINRKVYDTDTAQPIALFESLHRRNCPGFYTEHLYLMDNGELFLHGKGGAFSTYAKQYKNRCSQPGEAIVPLSIERAKRWVKFVYDKGLIIHPHYAEIINELNT